MTETPYNDHGEGNPMQCARCEQPHAGCKAHRRDGTPCRSKRMKGQAHCRMHGGSAPAVRAAATRRLELAEAKRQVAALGLRRDIDPSAALLEEVQVTAGHVEWLRLRVQSLQPDELVWGTVLERDKRGGEDEGHTVEQRAVPHVWYQLYTQERDRLVRVCEAALKAGVEARRIELAEKQGVLIAEALKRILADLQLTPEQTARVPEVVPRHLRAISARPGEEAPA